MNFFILDLDPTVNATYYYDKLLVTAPLYAVKALYGAHASLRKAMAWRDDCPFVEVYHHYTHPLRMWVESSVENYLTLCRFTLALCVEYEKRTGKQHKMYEHVMWMSNHSSLCFVPQEIKSYTCLYENPKTCTPFPLIDIPKELQYPSLLQSMRMVYLLCMKRYRGRNAGGQVPLHLICRKWNLQSTLARYVQYRIHNPLPLRKVMFK